MRNAILHRLTPAEVAQANPANPLTAKPIQVL
jgi:hypothetical protein